MVDVSLLKQCRTWGHSGRYLVLCRRMGVEIFHWDFVLQEEENSSRSAQYNSSGVLDKLQRCPIPDNAFLKK